jgi:chloramphenicol-sensitive protein RarD
VSADVRQGFIAAFAAYSLWGVLPLYLHLLQFARPEEVLASRILWSIPAIGLALTVMGGWAQVRAGLTDPHVRGRLVLSAVLIAINWWVYVWAVANNRVMEASLAYFLTPLVNVAMGVALFQERLRPLQGAAVAVAGFGVVVQGLAMNAAPWAALVLCASWSCYALVRKQTPVSAAGGLFIETLVLAPVALGGLLLLASWAPLGQAASPGHVGLMALAGPITALPLILFAIGARRLQFSTLGLLQFIAPSLQFLVAVLLGEALTPLRLVSFMLIWGGLVLFTLDAWRQQRPATPSP